MPSRLTAGSAKLGAWSPGSSRRFVAVVISSYPYAYSPSSTQKWQHRERVGFQPGSLADLLRLAHSARLLLVAGIQK